MKAGIIFTGSGPILILTTYDTFSEEKFIAKLQQKNIRKFIAVDVPVDMCAQRYGNHYNVILNDLKQDDDLRVLDYNGHTVLHNFKFDEWGPEFRYEE